MPKRRTARQAAASRRNLDRARQAQRRSNAKLGTTGVTGANSAIKGYRKANAFISLSKGAMPTGKRLRRKRV